MSLVLDGTAGVSGCAAIKSAAANILPTLQDSGGNSAVCRAWVQFAGATGTIAAAFNVSSVTRTGVGTYTVNFTSAMPDIKYASLASCGSGSSGGGFAIPSSTAAPTTTTCNLNTVNAGGTGTDYAYISFAIFR